MAERTRVDNDRATTAPPPAITGDERPAPKRKLSLASELETMTQSGAFLRAVQENRPEVAVCRAVLQKRPGRRSIDEIHVLKSLLATSKLLEFFSNLDAYKIDKLYQSIDIANYDQKGAIIFEEDDPGENFYMVFRGQGTIPQRLFDTPQDILKSIVLWIPVEIRQRERRGSIDSLGKKPVTQHIAFLEAGDSFGERALLYESDRRAASAFVASDSAELIFINRNVFTDLLKESNDAHVTGAATLEITKRFRSNKDIIRNIFMRTSTQRSEKDLKFAVEYLKSVKFFARFSFEVRKQLCKAMKLISAVTNTVLFEEGQEGRHFYMIFSGGVEVSVRTKNRFEGTTSNVVSRLSEGEYFGELALSEVGGLRRATVTCADFCELLVLGRDQYEPLIKKYQNEYHAQYAKMLSKNPYFIGPEWDNYTIQAMCAVMAEKYFPFRGEICRQGSRATEMFVVTRGECVMVHEGRHPITGQPQQYELGRFGPNSVLGCTEASAGRFNDIYTRDYSIVAESPVRLLVLSRFDIFHLMSASARESLQRSSVAFTRESIESRAIKTVVWEKYRKEFLADVMAKRDRDATLAAPGRSLLGKSASTPSLVTVERGVKKLVAPGQLVLELRPGRVVPRKGPLAGIEKLREISIPTDSAIKSAVTTEIGGVRSEERSELRRKTVQNGTEDGCESATKDQSLRPLRKPRQSTPQEVEAVDEGGETECGESLVAPLRQSLRARRQSMIKSKTCAVLDSAAQQTPELSPSLAHGFHEKPLYSSGSLGTVAVVSHPPPPSSPGSCPSTPSTSERRRSVRLRSDAALKMPIGNTNSASAIWTPIHGACQPFALLGFLRERSAPVSSPKPAHMASAASSCTSKVKSVDPEVAIPSITAFRIFGKFTELNEVLDLFRHVCSLETSSPERDTSRFAVYKEDEMTMAMENYFGDSTNPPYQYCALDLPRPTGQRFACVAVSVEMPAQLVENVLIHVYQCFPTPQSAARFAKQMAAASLATLAPLCVVPLFEWVPLAELERFDARNADLEQAIENVTLRSGDAPRSTYKARKDAVKKAHVVARKRA